MLGFFLGEYRDADPISSQLFNEEAQLLKIHRAK